MYPKASRQKRYSLALPKRQAGFLIPLAIFIVVVMGLLALALARTTTQTGLATAQELVSLQAFYTAESGAQHGMNHLFYGQEARLEVDSQCNDYSEVVSFSVTGLKGCTATITCECSGSDPDTGNSCGSGTTGFYEIETVGSCGSGVISAQRSIRVSAFMDQE